MNSNRLTYGELPFRPEQLAEMVKLIDGGKISGKIAKEILPELLAAHPDEVEAFRGGKNKLQGFFVGQLMKKTGGKADPKLANQILSQKLKG